MLKAPWPWSRKIFQIVYLLFAIVLPTASCFAEEGITPDRILLGTSTSLTGQLGERCNAFQSGAALYLDEVNKTGGIFGRQVKIVVYDDGFEPQKAASNVRKLVETDHIFALFQVHGTPTVKAILPLVEQADVPLLNPLSSADFLRVPVNKNIFHIRTGFSEQAGKMIDFLVNSRKISRIGVLSQDDSGGTSAMSAFQSRLNHYDLKRVSQGRYKRNTTDVDQAFEDIRSGEPAAVLLSGPSAPGVAFIKKAVKMKFRPIFIATSTMNQDSFARELKDTDAEIYVAQDIPYLVSNELAIHKDFHRAVTVGKLVPDMALFEGYMNARFLVEALKRAGKDPTRVSLLRALEGKPAFDLGGLSISFSPINHQGLNLSSLVKLTRGHFVPVSD